MKSKLDLFLSFLLIVLLFVSAKAAPGDLDTTFNLVGYATPTFGGLSSTEPGEATIVQPDGKTIVVGSHFASVPGGNDAVIVRFRVDGSLDTSFDTDGIVTFPPENSFSAVTLQPDGKIVAAGMGRVVRLNPDGSFDPTFGVNGIVMIQTPYQYVEPNDLVVQPNGKIVLGGSARVSVNLHDTDFAVLRYNADGSPDMTFDGDGMRFLDLLLNDSVNSLALQLDGKIIAAGISIGNIVAGRSTVIRYNTDGSLDTGFDGDGIVLGSAIYASGLAVQWDGRILVAGSIRPSSYDFAVTRYKSDGTVDTSYGTKGMAITHLALDDIVRAAVLQSDGKFVVAGFSTASNGGFAIVRHNADGSLDGSFGSGGHVLAGLPTPDQGYDVSLSPDAKIVFAGEIGNNFGVARFQGSTIAATAKINGQVVNSRGQGISKARVVLTNTQNGQVKIRMTNPFGYYSFPDLPTAQNYTISVSSKSHQFYQPTQSVQLYIDVLGLHFIGTAP